MVFILCRLTDAVISDIPEALAIKIRREKYLAKRALQESSKYNQVRASLGLASLICL